MHILTLLLLCIYTPTALYGASARTGSRRKKATTMTLGQYSQHVATVEHAQLINCLKEHEKTPCTTVSDFTVLKGHYEEGWAHAKNPKEANKWRLRLTDCNTRMNIMLDIESAQQIRPSTTDDADINVLAMQEIHWQALRDTYQSTTPQYTYYDEQSRLAGNRYKEMILNRDTAQILRQQTVSHDDYLNLYEKAKTLFGDRAEEVLAQLPNFYKISIMRSLIKNSQAPAAPSESTTLKTVRRNKQTAYEKNQVNQAQGSINFYLNSKNITTNARARFLSALYNEIAANSYGIEKLNATASANFYQHIHNQESLIKKAHVISRSLNSTDAYNKLKDTLIQLRDTYSVFDSSRAEYDYKISIVERGRWYHIGDREALIAADKNDCNIERKQHTQMLIARLERESALADLLDKPSTFAEERNAYLELLSTYNKTDAEHALFVDKILQLDLKLRLDEIESPDIDDLAYFTERLSIMQQLAQTYAEHSEEHDAIAAEIVMLKKLKVYTEAHNHVAQKIDKPFDETTVGNLHLLIKDLYIYAADINNTHGTSIPTDWMKTCLEKYNNHITLREMLRDLKAAADSTGDTRDRQRSLLRQIINSPLTDIPAKKEHLIRLIELTEEPTQKIRLIRDELLQSGTLDTNEQIRWNTELAQQNLTKKIRSIREKLNNPSMLAENEQIALNKELAACYAQRNAQAKK